jgi:propanol-preferring alcohol dehydrogenase
VRYIDYQKYLYGERDVHPVEANTRQDGRELLVEAAAAGVRPRTRRYALQEANQALADMKAGRIDGTGVLMIGN